MKILLVEDDPATASALAEALTLNHYSVDNVADGEMALKLAEAFTYDLILLDIVIPKIDGLHVCQHLRSEGCQVPILLLTARESSGDRVLGLDAGADDYLVKPFDFAELLARMRALLRRGSATLPPTLTWEKLHFNPGKSEFTYTDQLLHLTPKEYGLLELFISNPTRIFSRSAIIDHLWTSDTFPGEEAVNTHMKTLRQKLKAAGASADFIETVYGMGYRLKPLQQQTAVHPVTLSSATSTQPDQAGEERVEVKLAEAMEQLKVQFQSYFLEQLAVLEQVAVVLPQQKLTPELQQQGKQEAHKLAGSLGIYGFEKGSALARQLETLLMSKDALGELQAKQFDEWLSRLRREIQPQAMNHSVDGSVDEPWRQRTQPSMSVSPPDQPPTLLVIDGDRTLTQLIKLEGKTRGIEVEVIGSIAAARTLLFGSEAGFPPQNQLNLILLDLTFPDSNENGLEFLKELTQQAPEIPVVVFTGSAEIETRVKVAQWGGCAFLQKPMLPQQIFPIVERILQAQGSEHRVMVVDDDPATLVALTALLKSHHLNVTTLDEPQQFWNVLTFCKPDLLVLDIEMPTFSGIELCQTIRTDPQWSNLPILILSAHQEPDIRHRACAAGADEYILKPYNEVDLLARIAGRLDRVRL